jgi:hypothetical protein
MNIIYFFDGKDCGRSPRNTKIDYKKKYVQSSRNYLNNCLQKKIKSSTIILSNSHELEVALPKFPNPKPNGGYAPFKNIEISKVPNFPKRNHDNLHEERMY